MKLKVYFRAPIRKYPVNTKPHSGIFTRIMGPADVINCEMCKADTAIFPSSCVSKECTNYTSKYERMKCADKIQILL
jgi:hypothetical protein